MGAARLSNLTCEPDIYLDLTIWKIKAIQLFLDTPARLGGIGHRINNLKIYPMDKAPESEPPNNRKRVIAKDILDKIPTEADIAITLSFGSTHFRFSVILPDGTIETNDIPSTPEEFEDSAILRYFAWNSHDKKDRLFQEGRIVRELEKLFTKYEKKALGISFSSAGVLRIEGSISQPKVRGMGTDKNPFNVAKFIENNFHRPAIALNDVDAEGSNTLSIIIQTAKEIINGMVDPKGKYYPLAKVLADLKDGESVIFFSYGGGTGIGACQYKITRHGDDFSFKILTGPGVSAGESGHDFIDFNHPTINMAINKLSMSESNLKSLLDYRRNKTCDYCGNFLDLESLSSGSAGDYFAKWVYSQLKKQAKSHDERTRKTASIELFNYEQSITTSSDNTNAPTVANLINLYHSGSKIATEVFEFMAKIFAAHMVTHYELGESINVDVNQQTWNNFIIDQGMFRNEFFKNMVLDSLKNDFGTDYTQIFKIVFDYNENNQSLGAMPVLMEAIRVARLSK